KLAFYTDSVIKDAVEDAKAQLGEKGRIVVRASGTEPVLRVMVEHEDLQAAEQTAEQVSSVIRRRLENK
ncbi:MAG: phosphoglucosamine mutase, partial [Clostridia bacterium]|nr:phosphoglucosamine mutase [Clostridia bacterium]